MGRGTYTDDDDCDGDDNDDDDDNGDDDNTDDDDINRESHREGRDILEEVNSGLENH